MLHVVRPVKLNEHVVVALLKVLVLFPGVAILPHLAVFVDKTLLLSLSVLNLRNDKAHIRVVVIDGAIEAALISLVHAQVGVAAWGTDLEADEREGVQLMARLEEGVPVVVVDAAQLDAAEVLDQIFLAHEEGTIVGVAPPGHSLGLVGPAVGVIAPIALPLEVTPGVSQLEEPDLITEAILDDNAADQTI